MDPFVIHRKAVSPKQDVQPSIAKSRAFGRTRPKALQHGNVRRAGARC
jgi:hypothetical protein